MAKNFDFRLQVGWRSHLKMRKIFARYRGDGLIAWQAMIEYASEHKPDGNLGPISLDDLELICDTQLLLPNAPFGEFAQTLVDLALVDVEEATGCLLVHDWHQWQPWASGAAEREEASRKAGKASGEARRKRKLKEAPEAEHERKQTERSEVQRTETNGPFKSVPVSDEPQTRPDQTRPDHAAQSAGFALRGEEGLPAPSTPEEVRERHRLAEEIQARWNAVARALGPPLVESVVIDDVRRVEEALWRHEDVRAGILEAIGRFESHGVAKWRRKPLKLLDLCDPGKLGNCLNGSWTGEYQEPQVADSQQAPKRAGAEFEAWALGELAKGVIHRAVEHPTPAHLEAIQACGGWRALGEARSADIPRLLKPGRELFERRS